MDTDKTALDTDWQYPKNKTFVRDALPGPIFTVGNIVEIRSGKRKTIALIGDLNINGGTCDDCSGYSIDDTVIRWKAVWRP